MSPQVLATRLKICAFVGYYTTYSGKGIKAALSGLYDTDACRDIVSLPLTEFTPSSPEALHTKQA
jgi:hypothetical protein